MHIVPFMNWHPFFHSENYSIRVQCIVYFKHWFGLNLQISQIHQKKKLCTLRNENPCIKWLEKLQMRRHVIRISYCYCLLYSVAFAWFVPLFVVVVVVEISTCSLWRNSLTFTEFLLSLLVCICSCSSRVLSLRIILSSSSSCVQRLLFFRRSVWLCVKNGEHTMMEKELLNKNPVER